MAPTKKLDLLQDGDDSDDDIKFTINKNYAERYTKWRQGEELQKLKDKYGAHPHSEDSSTSEDEDDDARELTEDIEKNFFKTLSCLKEKNPKIYDKSVRFFKNKADNVDNENKGKKNKLQPSMSLGEYQRKVLFETGGQFSDDDEKKSLKGQSCAEQEKALKQSFKDVLKDSDSENEKDEWGSLFTKRKKTEEEMNKERDDYKSWLAGEKKRLKNSEAEKELKGLHDFWSNPKLDENERFLRDYILNKRFLEKDDKNRIPAYDEIVHDSDSGLSADENYLEEQEEFERKYNFRFEEPDKEFIKRYPRTMENSMRKKDNRRKQRRKDLEARKEKEKERKTEELKRLKALKRKEIMEKIKKIQEITGNEDIGLEKKDLEEDFDPEKHDQRMAELFNEDYYADCQEEEKPENKELDEELELENWDEWEGEGEEKKELHCEDPGFNMDCDYDPRSDKKELEKELIDSCNKKRKRRRSKFAEAVAREKPIFDPKDKTFEKYVDEYYSLDYEDLIGDLPCRFKYRKVIPNDFGLTVEEILAAPDKELNQWASVRKIMQRRTRDVELSEVKTYSEKAKDFERKKKLLPSVYGPEMESEETSAKALSNFKEHGIRNGNRKNMTADGKRKGYTKYQPMPQHKKKNAEGKWAKEEALLNMSDHRIKSYCINPTKLKNQLKYGKKN